jgi:ferredoxin
MSESFVLSKKRMPEFFSRLAEDHLVIGPVRQRGAVVLAPVAQARELAYCVGSPATPIKRFFHRPLHRVLVASGIKESGLRLEDPPPPEKQALFAIHSCDLHALDYLDRALLHDFHEPHYEEARKKAFIVALNCTEVAENCHCVSYGTGPEATEGYDLALTNLGDRYLLEVGTEAGAAMAAPMRLPASSEQDREMKRQRIAAAAQQIKRPFNTVGVPQLLAQNYRHLAWQEEAAKCLGCGNCAMSCPTCYCYHVMDQIAIPPERIARLRSWDVCLLQEFAEVHGANFRPEREARFKQFVYHKLSYSLDQYGTFGCVGCGRCMTWCPAEIDYRVPVDKIREEQ